jgi:hypothetical protein
LRFYAARLIFKTPQTCLKCTPHECESGQLLISLAIPASRNSESAYRSEKDTRPF